MCEAHLMEIGRITFGERRTSNGSMLDRLQRGMGERPRLVAPPALRKDDMEFIRKTLQAVPSTPDIERAIAMLDAAISCGVVA